VKAHRLIRKTFLWGRRRPWIRLCRGCQENNVI